MKVARYLCVLYLISISTNVLSGEFSIARIIKDNEIHQLSSNDWTAYQEEEVACLIDIKTSREMIPVSPPLTNHGCSNYAYRVWKEKTNDSNLDKNRAWALLYIRKGNDRGCTVGFIQPKITFYDELPVIPSYIDIKSLKNDFARYILINYLNKESSEKNIQKENDLYFIQRGDFPKITIKLEDYDYPQGGGHFHYAKIYLTKNTPQGSIKVAIAEYWVRVYNSSVYKVLHKTIHYINWLKKHQKPKNNIIDIPKTYFGPYSTGGKFYFINESHGYESITVKLLEYSVWGEGMNVGKTISKWEDGC